MSIVFIISAPSGSGKSTLVSRLMDSLEGLYFSISCTTRAPRKGEKDGENYRFVTREEFLRMRDSGGLLEWAEVFGNYYGTKVRHN
jgi:guanylate kinase